MKIKSAVKKQKITVNPSRAKLSLKFNISKCKTKLFNSFNVFADITQ